MNPPPELMVKQYVGLVRDPKTAATFQVFETGDSRFLLFDPMVRSTPNGAWTSACMQFPVRKRELRRGWRRFMVVD